MLTPAPILDFYGESTIYRIFLYGTCMFYVFVDLFHIAWFCETETRQFIILYEVIKPFTYSIEQKRDFSMPWVKQIQNDCKKRYYSETCLKRPTNGILICLLELI